MRFLHYFIATALGAGYSPTAPGTAGTLLGLGTAYFLVQGNQAVLMGLTALVFLIGTISANYVEQDLQTTDPSRVVIDEVAGMWIGLWFLPVDPWIYISAFGLFRIFDVLKPFPVDWLQELPGGWGIMLDDIGAGLYTLLLMQVILYFL